MFKNLFYSLLAISIALFNFVAPVLAAPGGLDLSFDSDGSTVANIISEGVEDIVVQQDGRIVAVGTDGGGNLGDLGNFIVSRYNSNGSLDTTFDGDGTASVDFAGLRDVPYSVVVDSSGRIVVGGWSRELGFALVRLNSDGSLDATFDSDGKVSTNISGTANEAIRSLVIDSNGKIVVAGTVQTADIAVARYNTNGSLDTTFAGGGIAIVDFSSRDIAAEVRLQSDGKIVVAGTAVPLNVGNFALARLNTGGTLDNTFGINGKTTTGISSNGTTLASAMELQSDGKVVVGGTAHFGPSQDFALARYTANGVLDTTFDSDGIASTNFAGSDDNNLGDVAITGDGKIIAAGNGFITGRYRSVSVRYNSNGSIDTSYGINTNGKAIIEVSGYDVYPQAVAIQSDGQIVVGGLFDNGTNFYFGINRVNGSALENNIQTTLSGGSLSMDSENDGAQANDPVETTVTTPVGGIVSISETTAATPTASEISFLGQKVSISAPPQTVASPLVVTLRIDNSIIPPGENKDTIQVYKDGAPVPACSGVAGQASPDPCISSRNKAPGGDVDITVLTLTD
jgi:uncharacterized delta-60 repeat protein